MDWQPIDTAPTMETIIITGFYTGTTLQYVEESFKHRAGHFNGRKNDPPTHWMPLPDPPSVTEAI